jgi:hypothetical protein
MPSFVNDFLAEVSSMFSAVGELPDSTLLIIAFAFLAVGALFCFVGYYFFKYLLGLGGFLTAGVIGLAAAHYYFPSWPEIGQFAVAAAAGTLGAIIFYFLFFYFGFVVFGAVAVMWVTLLLVPEQWGLYRTLLTLGAGFTGGLMAVMLRRPLIILATAAIGAISLVAGIGHFQGWPLSPSALMRPDSLAGSLFTSLFVLDWTQQTAIFGLAALFFAGGLAVQSLLPERKDERRKK